MGINWNTGCDALSFSDFTHRYGTTGQIQQNEQSKQPMSNSMDYFAVTAPLAMFSNVFAMIAVFAFKDRFKVIGTTLIIIAIITVIAMGYFGIVGFGLLLAAGIVAFRYKNKQLSAIV